MTELDLEQRQRLEADLWDEYVERPGLADDLMVPLINPDRLEPKLRWVFQALGDLSGKEVLDFGCGTARTSIYLAKMGARVSGFDISAKSIEIAKRRAEVNGVADQTEFRVCGGEQLDYEDESFDIVFGMSILHHVVLEMAAREIHRVLRPGGHGVFLDPQGTNPVVSLVRHGIPYPGKKTHGTDRPLTLRDIRVLRQIFPTVDHQSFNLLSGIEKMFGFRRRFPRLQRLDVRLLRWFPWLWRLYVYMGVRVQR